jgi:hypothetical protein
MYPQSGYDELDATPHMIPRPEHFRITPSPGAVTDRYGNQNKSIHFNSCLYGIRIIYDDVEVRSLTID